MNPATAAIAEKVVEDYYAAFNARDPIAFKATFNFPHVTIRPGAPIVSGPDDYTAAMFTIGPLADWDHSSVESREVIHADENKAHVAVRFTRHRLGGGVIGTFDVIYVITLEDGRWGMKAMSGVGVADITATPGT